MSSRFTNFDHDPFLHPPFDPLVTGGIFFEEVPANRFKQPKTILVQSFGIAALHSSSKCRKAVVPTAPPIILVSGLHHNHHPPLISLAALAWAAPRQLTRYRGYRARQSLRQAAGDLIGASQLSWPPDHLSRLAFDLDNCPLPQVCLPFSGIPSSGREAGSPADLPVANPGNV